MPPRRPGRAGPEAESSSVVEQVGDLGCALSAACRPKATGKGTRRGLEAVEDVEDCVERVLYLSGPVHEVVGLHRWAFGSGTFVGSVEVDSEEDGRILREELGDGINVRNPMEGWG